MQQSFLSPYSNSTLREDNVLWLDAFTFFPAKVPAVSLDIWL